MRNVFRTYHPIVNLLFIVSVVAFTVVLKSPVFLAISAAGSFACTVALNGKRALKFDLLFALPLLLAIAVLNPIFVHQGFTMLFYIDNNPVTMEAILYGGALALMTVSVSMWLYCCNRIFSSDKIIWLFGRVIPFLGLSVSMLLRMIPRMGAQLRMISRAQRAIGMGIDGVNPLRWVKNGVRMLSILVTWTAENMIEVSDSMKARGYGLRGRTSFSVFRFDGRDGACTAALAARRYCAPRVYSPGAPRFSITRT